MIGKLINAFVPHEHLLAYLESILRVYNRYGRRDNKYKARIKILVHEEGLEAIKGQVEAEFADVRGGVLTLPQDELDRISAYFAPPHLRQCRTDGLRSRHRCGWRTRPWRWFIENNLIRTSSRAMRASQSRSSRSAARRATPVTRRWMRWPTLPRAIRSTSCG